jgi:hypothetical protein
MYFLLLATRIYFFRQARQKDVIYDSEQTTPYDFAVMLKGLPKTSTEEEVVKIFSDHVLENGRKPVVRSVNFAYFIGDYIEAANKAGNIKLRLIQETQKPVDRQNQTLISRLKIETEEINKELLQIKGKLKNKA